MEKTRTIKTQETYRVCDICGKEKYKSEDEFEIVQIERQCYGDRFFDAHLPCMQKVVLEKIDK